MRNSMIVATLLTLSACGDRGDPVTGEDGCVLDPDAFMDLRLEPSEDVPTVLRLRWDSPQPTVGIVKFVENGNEHVLPPEPEASTDHEAFLFGSPAMTDVEVTISQDDGQQLTCLEPFQVTTGNIPAGLPEPTLAIHDPDKASGGWYAVSVLTSPTSRGHHMAIFDSAGRYVWTRVAREGTPYRFIPSGDGTTFLVDGAAEDIWSGGVIQRFSLDGKLIEEQPFPGHHSDFVELPDGLFSALGWEIREFEYEGAPRYILGDTVLESDGEGGSELVWSMLDHMDPDLSVRYPNAWYTADEEVEDWTHGNAMSYCPDDDAWFFNFFLWDAVMKVDRATGEILWTLSGQDGDFENVGGEPFPLANAHSVKPTGDGRLLFFNRGYFEPGECSSVVEAQLDTESMTVEELWRYETEDCLQTVALGEAIRLENGNNLVIWGFSGRMEEVTPEGESVYRVNLELGGGFGYGGWFGELAPEAYWPRHSSYRRGSK